ncbi:MAG: HAD family hydrolase [Malacoplasma sp.]|nr:HAD family hydrolase [Malacoplasma sp.]
MYVKYVYFDLDGTLVPDGVSISNRTLLAIEYLKSKGIKVGIATGRSLFFTDYFANLLNVNLPLICANGAWTLTPKDFLTLETIFINDQALQKLINYFEAEQKDFLVYTTSGIFTTSVNLEFFKRLSGFIQKNVENKTKSKFNFEMRQLNSFDEFKKLSVLKVLINYSDVQEKIKYEKFLSSFSDLNFDISPNSKIFDIYNADTDKGKAIMKVVENKRFFKRDMMVFGDNENDLKMFAAFPANAVALKNAEYNVRKAAKYTTDFTCQQEGVADFIFKRF